MLERFEPGSRVVLERNPNYYEPGLPLLDRIEYRIIPDETLRQAALGAKAVHVTWSVERRLQRDSGIVEIEPMSYCAQLGLAFNQTKLPFSDVRVRRAVSVGIDRSQLITAVLRGRGHISTKIPPCDAEFGYSGNESGMPYYAPNLALGRKLLAEVGLSGGLDTVLEVPSAFPQTVRTGEVIKEQLARIGVRVTIKDARLGRGTRELHPDRSTTEWP